MKYPTLATFLGVLLLIADLAQAADENVCNISLILKANDIERCESNVNPDEKVNCLEKLFGAEWAVTMDEKKMRFKSASTASTRGLFFCFGKSTFKTSSDKLTVSRENNESTFYLYGIENGTTSNITIIESRICGLSLDGDLLLKPAERLAKFLPLSKRYSAYGFRCQNEKEFSINGLRLLEPAVFCGFKASKSTDFDERNTGFWHFVAENSGTLTYNEANGKTVRVKIKDGEDYHIKRPDLNPCKWEKSSKELLEPSWID
jgi:uncharacterized protein (UPF0216 family)